MQRPRFERPALHSLWEPPSGARAGSAWQATVAAALVLAAAAGCDAAPSGPGKDPPAPSAAAPASATPAASATGPTAADAARPELDASAPGPADLRGTWEGPYDAKKGTIELPARVKDKTHDGDDGKSSVGPGTIHLVVGADGEIRGKGTGALGIATLSGRAEGGMIRITVLPDDPLSNSAMTGVLIGAFKEGVIKAELHVAGPDAKVVRESSLELKRR